MRSNKKKKRGPAPKQKDEPVAATGVSKKGTGKGGDISVPAAKYNGQLKKKSPQKIGVLVKQRKG